jgi:hypothetical protein
MKNSIKFFIWLLVVILTTTWGFDLINLPSTIANLIGVTLLFAIGCISVKTKCFTTINLTKNKKENEESNV